MTRFGVGAALAGLTLLVGGWFARWPSLVVVGAAIVILVAGSGLHVIRRPRLDLRREIEPPEVEKGSTAIAVVHATNLSRRTLAALPIEQRVGVTPVRAVLPRLRRGESGLRSYRLPTTRRGVFEIGPIELPRADPFGLCRTVQRLGQSQGIAVRPRLAALAPVPTGNSRNLEGPASDTSPQGTTTFHRLREYAMGDDLRSIHWPSTARLGKLVVRHNVDTAQPTTVVLFDRRPGPYSEQTFEEAVDIVASVVTSLTEGKAPAQLWTTGGDHLSARSDPERRAVLEFLTRVQPVASGSLLGQLALLRRDRGGTTLVVVTGRLDLESLPAISALQRRFDRIVAISVIGRPAPAPTASGTTVLVVSGLDHAAIAWNTQVAR